MLSSAPSHHIRLNFYPSASAWWTCQPPENASRTCMSLHILKIFSVFAVLLSSLPAHAAERISVWGIYNGCERVPEFDRLLDRHLNKAGVTSWTLSAPQSACQGEACAERAQAECGLSDGLILGGRVW